MAQLVKILSVSVGDLGSIPGLGRSPGDWKGYPLQYFGLENSMDWTVCRVAKSRTQLSGLSHSVPHAGGAPEFHILCFFLGREICHICTKYFSCLGYDPLGFLQC